MKYGVCLESKYKDKMLAEAGKYDQLVVDAADYTAAEIKRLKAGRKTKVLSYINVGAVETDRSYFSAAKQAGLLHSSYDNWPGEYWVRADKAAWRTIILDVADKLAAKGIDGFWVDNLDVLYMACEKWKWSTQERDELFTSLLEIMDHLHALGYTKVNGGDSFVLVAIGKSKDGCIDAVNQETVITKIKNYNPPGKFAEQDYDESAFFKWYVEKAARAGKEVSLLEYTDDETVIEKAVKYCTQNGFSLCVSGSVELGGAITTYETAPQEPPKSLDRLTLVIAVSDVLLGEYKKDPERARRLTQKFGAEGAAQIQQEVNVCLGRGLEDKYMAVACIADHYGKNPERARKLGRRADKVQKRINAIYAMRGKTVEQAAKDVINGNYDVGAVRELLLTFCGYTPGVIQDKVNQIQNKTEAPKPEAPAAQPASKPAAQPTATDIKYGVHVEHFCRKDESAYGACTAFFQYAPDGKTIAKCVLVDTAMGKTASVVIEDLKAKGVKQIDALIISHAHGDHYGGLSKIAKAFPVKWLYIPDPAELDKYQKGYGNKLRQQALKVKNNRWYKPGDSFITGAINFECIFACKAKELKEHDSHHFVNNMSPVNRITMGRFIWHTAGDLQNPGNHLLVAWAKKNNRSLKCHGLEFQWHTDGNATAEDQMEATKPKICVSNYHHPGWHSGRKGPKQKAEKVGAKCYATADDGHIDVIISGKDVQVTTTKSKRSYRFTI